MAGGIGGIEGGEPEFQIAPMIDVLLVMLIFFMMITTAQVLKVDKNINLPIAPNAQKKDNARSEAIINVRWDARAARATFRYEDRDYPRAADFLPQLRAAREAGERRVTLGENPNFRVVIRGDRDVPALHVSRAMEVAAEAGIADISFSAVNRE
jgi:biopolymer transport protein ExbD